MKKIMRDNGGALHLIANVDAKLFDKDGKLKKELSNHNTVVNSGLAAMASRLNGDGGEAAFTYLAIGTGSTAVAATDTALGAEITTGGGARAAATVSRVTTDTTNDTAQLVHTFTFSASFSVAEAGVFNAASAGTMMARTVFGSAVSVVSGDTLQITWKFDMD